MSDVFLESPRFPGCPSFGYVSNPRYSTTKSQLANGKELRNRNWQYPLYSFQFTVGPRQEAEIEELLDFWHALGGEECGFRFKDIADYKTCRLSQTPSPTDAPIAENAVSPGSYQLYKSYSAGARQQLRKIHKPVEGTIRVANQLGVEQASSHWIIDYATGELYVLDGFTGTPTTWGGEFDVPVRFDSEFPIEIVSHKVESVQFVLCEMRGPFDPSL